MIKATTRCVRGLCLFVFAATMLVSSTSSAMVLKGVIRYQRNWAHCSNNPGSRVLCSSNGTLKGLQGMLIQALGGSGEVVQTATDGSGNYSMTLAGGRAYAISALERDGSLSGGSSAVGDANLAIVSSTTLPMTGFTDLLTRTGVLPSGNVTVTLNIDITSTIPAAGLDRINNYQIARVQQAIWQDQSASLPGSKYKERIIDTTSDARTELVCSPSNRLDCAAVVHANVAQKSPDTLWHEMGHGIADIIVNGATGGTNTYRSDTVPCPGRSSTETASFAFQEGWADFVKMLTMYPPNQIPANFNGGICNSCEYPPTGNQPNAPACGSGSIARVVDRVTKGLVELVDSTPTDPGCRPENLQLPFSDLLDAWLFFGNKTCGCGGPICGVEEGGLAEAVSCGISSPNWPYTGGNALPLSDQSGILDYFGILKFWIGIDGTALRDVWANTCWSPSDSAVTLP